MNRRATFSPVLLELIVVILFFALSMSVVVRLVAAANETSKRSALESRALLLMESTAETLKADPTGGDFDENGERRFTLTEDGVALDVRIRREDGAAGALYEIDVSAYAGGQALGELSAARYVRGEVGA